MRGFLVFVAIAALGGFAWWEHSAMAERDLRIVALNAD